MHLTRLSESRIKLILGLAGFVGLRGSRNHDLWVLASGSEGLRETSPTPPKLGGAFM